MSEVAFATLARPLVVLHALAGALLLGATTHHLLRAIDHFRGRGGERLVRVHARAAAWTCLVTILLGIAAYPAFRVGVRAAGLDASAPWASRLFEAKEHVGTLALPVVLALWLLARPDGGAEGRGAQLLLSVLANLLLWTAAIAGLVVTLERGV